MLTTTLDEGLVRWDDEKNDMVGYLCDIVWERWCQDRLDCIWVILE